MQLATMLDAGLLPSVALATVGKDQTELKSTLRRARGLVERGVDLPSALKRAKAISEFDFELLKSAAVAGQLGSGLRHIAEHRAQQLARVNSLKAALWMPKAVLFVGALAGLFIRIASYKQPPVTAFTTILLIVCLVLVSSHLFIRIYCLDRRLWLSWMWPIRIIRTQSLRFKQNFEQLFYRSFIWQYSGGVSTEQALANCQKLLTSPTFQANVEQAIHSVAKGTSTPQALLQNDLVLSKRMRQTLKLANQAGTLETAVNQELTLQQDDIDRRQLNDIKWIPRAYYVIILVIVFWYML